MHASVPHEPQVWTNIKNIRLMRQGACESAREGLYVDFFASQQGPLPNLVRKMRKIDQQGSSNQLLMFKHPFTITV